MSFNKQLMDNARQFAETLGGHEPDPFSLFPTIKIWGGETHVVRFLTSLADSVDLWIHDWKGSNHTRTICARAHYGTDCEICKIDNAYGNKCKPKYFRLLLAWDYSLIGASWTPKGGPNAGVSQPINPWGVISIPCGEEKTNWTVLDRASSDGYGFADSPRQDMLWRLEYVTDVGFQPPQAIPDAVLGNMPRQIQDDIFQWIQTHNQIDKYAQLFATCNGCNWEMWFGQGFKAPPSGRGTQQQSGAPGAPAKRGRKSNADKAAATQQGVIQAPQAGILNQFGQPISPAPQFPQQAPGALPVQPQFQQPAVNPPQPLPAPAPFPQPAPNPTPFPQPVQQPQQFQHAQQGTQPQQMVQSFGFSGQTATSVQSIPAPSAPAQPASTASAPSAPINNQPIYPIDPNVRQSCPTDDQMNQAAAQNYYPVFNSDGSFNSWTYVQPQAGGGVVPPVFQQPAQQPMQMPSQQVAPAQAVPQAQLPAFQQFQQPVAQTAEQFAQQHQQITQEQQQFPGPQPILPPQVMPNFPQAAPAPAVPQMQSAVPAQPAQNAPDQPGMNQYGQPVSGSQQTQFPPVPGVGQIMNNPGAEAQIEALKAQMLRLQGQSGQQAEPEQQQRRSLVTGAN